MKKIIITVIIAIGSSFMANAQSVAFTATALQHPHGRETLTFTVPKEVNVKYYRIDAGNDSLHMSAITTINAKRNSMLPVNYSYDVTAHHYTFFRITRVDMSGSMPVSAVIYNNGKIQQQESLTAGHTVVIAR